MTKHLAGYCKVLVMRAKLMASIRVAGLAVMTTTSTAYATSPAEIGRNCQIAAADELHQTLGIEGTASRVLSPEKGLKSQPNSRLIEIDTTRAGLKVTYVFACFFADNQAFVSLAGHR